MLRGGELVEVARLAISDSGERGVHGIAVDPDFDHNRHVWIYYSTDGPPIRNRLVRFRNVGDQLVDEKLILETPDLFGDVHNGGCIRFGPDETIFLSTGDDLQQSDTSQNPDDIRGKILHINRDGSPAKGNPYLDGGGDPRVWAIDFRNPWRFGLQPESDNLFIGDVGAGSYEELDIGVPGGNFGWGRVEGPEPPGVPGMSYPIYSYPHTSEIGHAIIAGEHANARNFPPEYEEDFFFGDFITKEIFRMVLDESNQPISVDVFASHTQHGPVDIRFGPDGALYYLTFNGGQLFRISFVGGSNRQPVATATPDSGGSPLTVTFDASASFDPDGTPLTFAWDFGDGTRSNGPVVTTEYPAGSYEVSLTVTGSEGGESIVRGIRIVSGNTRPSAILNFPADRQLYTEGELIQFAGSAFDREEGLIPCRQFVWTIIFHHKGHTHPFLGPLQGSCSGIFVIDSHGEEQTFYEISLTVQDEGMPLGDVGKLTGTRSIALFPRD